MIAVDVDETAVPVPGMFTQCFRAGRLAGFDDDVFLARMRTGKGPKESIMPWLNYANMTDTDLRSVFMYLQSIEPSDRNTGPSVRPKGWKPEASAVRLGGMEAVQERGMRRPRMTVGALLVGIGIVHNLVGIAFGLGWLPPPKGATPMAPLVDIVRAGVVGAVEPDPWRMIFFWFVMTGFAMMLAGLAAHAIERAGLRLSVSFAFSVAAFSVIGIVLIPASGFWLGLMPAGLALARSRWFNDDDPVRKA